MKCSIYNIDVLADARLWLLQRRHSGLIPRTLGPFNVFILLNSWTCLHGVLLLD